MRQDGPRALDSLEWKLPLLIGGLVVVVVAAAMFVTQHELRQNAREIAYDRLQRSADELGSVVAASLQARAEQSKQLVAEPTIVAALQGSPVDPAAVRAVLERLWTRQDSAFPIELHDSRGALVTTTAGAAPSLVAEGASLATYAAATDSVAYGPLHTEDGRGVYWVSIPVIQQGRVLGHVHQQRPLGSRAAGEQIEQLLGGIEIQFTNRNGGPWIGLNGDVTTAGEPVPALGTPFRREQRPDGARYTHAAPLPATPWLIITEVPVAEVLAGPQAGVRRLLFIGTILLLIGGIAAWLVSRSVTAPLGRLGAAADAIAAGDYTRRTGVQRTDEIGQLARSFDQMVAHVDATHHQLAERYSEARALAAQLESANEKLTQAVTQLEHAQLEAQQASRAKSEFLATMSHEIRTPINAVIGYADLLDLGVSGDLTAHQRDYLERIRRSSEHLVAVVNDVLDFAKIESGQMRVLREPRAAAAAIDAAVAMLQGKAAEKGIRLTTRVPQDAQFLGDAQRVQQILLNLLSNALKFTAEGGSVTITCDQRQSRSLPDALDMAPTHAWTCITVTDTGPGIPPDQQERIFEPFVQGAAGYTRSHGGTGLGLAISRSLARMMGGDLTVESKPSLGASFTVWIPHPASEGVVAA